MTLVRHFQSPSLLLQILSRPRGPLSPFLFVASSRVCPTRVMAGLTVTPPKAFISNQIKGQTDRHSDQPVDVCHLIYVSEIDVVSHLLCLFISFHASMAV